MHQKLGTTKSLVVPLLDVVTFSWFLLGDRSQHDGKTVSGRPRNRAASRRSTAAKYGSG